MVNYNNMVIMSGIMRGKGEYSHTIHGEDFYKNILLIERNSGTIDEIPLVISERLACRESENFAIVSGEYHSRNVEEGERRRLQLYVMVKDMEYPDEIPHFCQNQAHLRGYICKKPTYRTTPKGKRITDILLAVNGPYGKSVYIPCIAWGRNAEWASKLNIGTELEVYGRIQSRPYTKGTETRIAYELSISSIEKMEE